MKKILLSLAIALLTALPMSWPATTFRSRIFPVFRSTVSSTAWHE